MGHGSFVLGAYVVVFGTLLVYWWRVERGIRALEHAADAPAAGTRP